MIYKRNKILQSYWIHDLFLSLVCSQPWCTQGLGVCGCVWFGPRTANDGTSSSGSCHVAVSNHWKGTYTNVLPLSFCNINFDWTSLHCDSILTRSYIKRIYFNAVNAFLYFYRVKYWPVNSYSLSNVFYIFPKAYLLWCSQTINKNKHFLRTVKKKNVYCFERLLSTRIVKNTHPTNYLLW